MRVKSPELSVTLNSSGVDAVIEGLRERGELKVLARPQIMTLDNQPAFIQIGKRVPRITGTGPVREP